MDPGGYRASNDRSLDAATLRGVFLTTIGPDGRTWPFELDDEWAGDVDVVLVHEVGGTVALSPPPLLLLLLLLPPPPEDDDKVRRC